MLIAVPLILQTFLIFGIAYGACRLLKLPHRIAAPAGMIGASNFFELAVAVAVALFGTPAPAARATPGAVLTEGPAMLVRCPVRNNLSCRTCHNGWRVDRSAGDAVPCKNRKQNERQVPRMTKPKVAFICVHNSCRSQIAEALGKALASDVFESYSAGTETRPQINQDAVRLMKALYGIDMEQTQYSKLISDIPEPDIAISMGCNVGCPFIGRPFDDNWGLEDPTGKSDEEFKKVIDEIRVRIMELKQRLGKNIEA